MGDIKRSSRWSKVMLEELVRGYEERSDILLQKKVSDRINDDKKQAWKEIADAIEKCNTSDTKKTALDCRNKFSDLKCRVKAKEAERIKLSKKTGGGVSPDIFSTEIDRKMLQFISPCSLEGIDDDLETGVSDCHGYYYNIRK